MIFSKLMGKQTNKIGKQYHVDSITIFLIFKLLFIRKPVSINLLRMYTKPISIIFFKLQIRKIFEKKFLKIFYGKKKNFISE